MNCKGCDPCKFCRYLIPSRGHRYDEPDEGRLARAEIWKEEAALDDGGLTWKCG